MLKREELDEIALGVWNGIKLEDKFQLPTYSKIFAHALLCEVQKRINPLGTAAQLIDDYVLAKSGLSDDVHLTTLPLIEE